jgi:hypothetical protein
LISKDLKVKHKDSGYEYTVDRIEGEGEEAIIYLRKPEIPRIQPPLHRARIHEEDDGDELVEPPQTDMLLDGEVEGDDIFIVTAQEFEKDYVVD